MSAKNPGQDKGGFVRLLFIINVCLRNGLDEFVDLIPAANKFRFLFWLFPGRWQQDKSKPIGIRLRNTLQALGPIFVKLGQLLSVRPDIVGVELAHDLIVLQDKVEPFSGDAAKRVIESELKGSIKANYKSFDPTPVASASIAQVHYAQLLDGSEVIIKVLRPGIEKIIQRDLAIQYTIARLINDYHPAAQRLKPIELVEDYDNTIHDELDLMREAANASQLRNNFENSDLIYVPRVYFDLTARKVMTMERISGISIRDIDKLKAAGIDMRKLAHDGVEIFFTQAFRDGFFHADMHPGNIFVAKNGQYRAVDFGIMGTLSDADKRYLAENFLAFFNRDYHGVAEAHIRAGWVPTGTRAEEFEAAIRTVCEPIFARPISEISFGKFILRLFQTARRFDMPVQTQLVLLQKTLLQIEGLGRQLYPGLDLWDTAKPFLERWMSEQIGPRAALNSLRRELPRLGKLAPELPNLAHELLRRLRDDELIVKTQSDEINQLRIEMRLQSKRTQGVIIGSALVVSAAVIAGLDGYAPAMLNSGPVWSWIMGLVGGLFLIRSWFLSK